MKCFCKISLKKGLFVAISLFWLAANAQKYSVDVRGAGLKPTPALEEWGGKRADGSSVYATNYHIFENGKPLAMTMAEFHPQRYPRALWEDAIVSIKAGGINTISFYVFWSLIEAVPGTYDFSGYNDIRAFLELCHKHDLKAIPRIGPFNNAEFLAGGIPPWIYGMPYTERSNDAGYLEVVKKYYAQVSEQMKGLYWQDGGPIYFVQLENELSNARLNWETFYRAGASDEHKGPADGKEWTQHYYHLRDMAQSVGINPLYFTATAWGPKHGDYPEGYLPMFGGYMYLGMPAANKNSRLNFFRDFDHVGRVPVGFCELGPAVTPARINYNIFPPALSATTTAMTAFGSIETLTLGYYMYHGGSNPISPRFGYMAKRDEFAMISYDYRSPLSEFGETRPAYYLLRPLHQFTQNYAHELTDAQSVDQDVKVENPNEARLRVKAKSNNNRGFLVTSYYGNMIPFADAAVQLEVTTDNGVVKIPSKGTMSIKNGHNYVFPFNLLLENGVNLISASAQPTSVVKVADETYRFFISPQDQPAEFVLDNNKVKSVWYDGKPVASKNGKRIVVVNPDRSKHLKVEATNGQISNIVLLTNHEAEHSIETTFKGQKYLVLSDDDVTSTSETIALTKCNKNELSFMSFPEMKEVLHKGNKVNSKKDGLFFKYEATLATKKINASLRKVTPSKTTLHINESEFDGIGDIYATVDFQGAICRVFDLEDGGLVADEFRAPWRISLLRFKKQLANKGLMVRVSPDEKFEKVTSEDGMLLDEKRVSESKEFKVKDITFDTEYKATFMIMSKSEKLNPKN